MQGIETSVRVFCDVLGDKAVFATFGQGVAMENGTNGLTTYLQYYNELLSVILCLGSLLAMGEEGTVTASDWM